jgi:hypothetical protein
VVCSHEHASATAAIAPARASTRDKFFAPERNDAVTALAGVCLDDGFVSELHDWFCRRDCSMVRRWRRPAPCQILDARQSGVNKKALSQPIGLDVPERNASDRFDANRLLVQWAPETEFDLSVYLGKQGVVASHPDIVTWVDLGAALAHDNAAGRNDLASIALDAQTLGV